MTDGRLEFSEGSMEVVTDVQDLGPEGGGSWTFSMFYKTVVQMILLF